MLGGVRNPGIVTSRRIFIADVPTLALHVILPRITTSWTRNLLEEWLFRWELTAHG
jgi:hypothetical protein